MLIQKQISIQLQNVNENYIKTEAPICTTNRHKIKWRYYKHKMLSLVVM